MDLEAKLTSSGAAMCEVLLVAVSASGNVGAAATSSGPWQDHVTKKQYDGKCSAAH